jgi:hypothetical protein
VRVVIVGEPALAHAVLLDLTRFAQRTQTWLECTRFAPAPTAHDSRVQACPCPTDLPRYADWHAADVVIYAGSAWLSAIHTQPRTARAVVWWPSPFTDADFTLAIHLHAADVVLVPTAALVPELRRVEIMAMCAPLTTAFADLRLVPRPVAGWLADARHHAWPTAPIPPEPRWRACLRRVPGLVWFARQMGLTNGRRGQNKTTAVSTPL